MSTALEGKATDTSVRAGTADGYTPTNSDYAVVGVVLTLFAVLLGFVVARQGATAVAAEALIGPVVALAVLTAAVWLLMVVVRNLAIMKRLASAEYYATYAADKAPVTDWVERPARTFNNLMQVPVLFYVVCLLMLVTGIADAAQLTLAWIFVGARLLHAVVYIGWNRGPYRFTVWTAACLALIVLWTRFALDSSGNAG